ncbi:MAG: type II toxin-antitoxin system VapC family toxin [Gemmatimonadota bacterium]|nr:type II toxin-antitoxin system VapC family toxin [Gemmatimonadota bacterium]
MRVLLDTQVWLWMLADPDRLSIGGRAVLQDGNSDLLLSAASAWEIAIKMGLRKLELPGPPDVVVPQMVEHSRVTPLPVLHTHALRVAQLPPHHRDPFDRLLVAQAQMEQVPIMTADPKFAHYGVEVMSP